MSRKGPLPRAEVATGMAIAPDSEDTKAKEFVSPGAADIGPPDIPGTNRRPPGKLSKGRSRRRGGVTTAQKTLTIIDAPAGAPADAPDRRNGCGDTDLGLRCTAERVVREDSRSATPPDYDVHRLLGNSVSLISLLVPTATRTPGVFRDTQSGQQIMPPPC